MTSLYRATGFCAVLVIPLALLACSQPEVRSEKAEQALVDSDESSADDAPNSNVSLADSPLRQGIEVGLHGGAPKPYVRSAWQEGSPKMEPISDDPAENPRWYWGPTYQFFDDGRYVFSDQSCTRDVRASVGTWRYDESRRSYEDGRLILREEKRIEDVGGALEFTDDRYCFLRGAERVVTTHPEPVVEHLPIAGCTDAQIEAVSESAAAESSCLSFDGRAYWIPSEYFVEDWREQWEDWFAEAEQGYPDLEPGAWQLGDPYLGNGWGPIHKLYEDGLYVYSGYSCDTGRRAAVGQWSYEKGTLTLNEERRIYEEGGTADGECIVTGADTVVEVHDEPVEKKISVAACPEALVAHQPDAYLRTGDCRYFDGEETWSVNAEEADDWRDEWPEWFEEE